MRRAIGQQKQLPLPNGAFINYEIERVGETPQWIVLLHGMGGNLTAWDKTRVLLRRSGFSTVAMDLRGHGLSFRPKKIQDFTMQRYCDDLDALAQSEQLGKYHLVGHCFGGNVAVQTAAINPELRSLTIVAMGYRPPPFTRFLQLTGLSSVYHHVIPLLPKWYKREHINYKRFRNTGDFNVVRLMNDYIHTSLFTIGGASHALLHFHRNKMTGLITVPTFLIAGETDTIYPLASIQELQRHLPQAKMAIIPGTGHVIPINKPYALSKQIAQFLQM